MKLYGTSAAHSTGGSQLVTQHATFNTKNTAKLNAIKMVKMFASTLKSTSRSLTLLALILFTGAAHAAKDPIYTPLLNNRAVGGYDVVSYFTEDAPIKGDKQFQTSYMGADWYFASQDNLDLFLADPGKYTPQYGGYCAYAAALGSTAKGDPLQYHLHDGKLFLNINQDIKQTWLGDKLNYIEKADKNWPDLLN